MSASHVAWTPRGLDLRSVWTRLRPRREPVELTGEERLQRHLRRQNRREIERAAYRAAYHQLVLRR
ncbi:hypothetical protein ASG12_06880 [Williamsia sp. Leaf354]|uniref:hypothetical protein n=1 Tax=Williamsia sp. Leaf354 TaxID=1736349 RepID=UPI000715B90E|nr:hypothetical protein [Williamsia sp. Leaf354]KQS00599.1 hypothetical protein ASG12_06880 [Williamsia sp. Leaf354]